MTQSKQYYALCQEGEIAFLHLRDDEELGRILGLAVYTAPEGEAQRDDLERYSGTVVAPVSREQLLDAMQWGVPNSVFIDGERIAGSVFAGLLKDEPGIPIRRPRLIRRHQDPGTGEPPV